MLKRPRLFLSFPLEVQDLGTSCSTNTPITITNKLLISEVNIRFKNVLYQKNVNIIPEPLFRQYNEMCNTLAEMETQVLYSVCMNFISVKLLFMTAMPLAAVRVRPDPTRRAQGVCCAAKPNTVGIIDRRRLAHGDGKRCGDRGCGCGVAGVTFFFPLAPHSACLLPELLNKQKSLWRV